MRKILSTIFFITAIIACNNADQKPVTAVKKTAADTAPLTTVKWIDSLKDIGTVVPGKKTEVSFKFSNSGSKPLYIVQAQPGCGCTVADYPKEPIMPGKEGEITANYDVATDAQGEFRKNIRVTTNTKERDTYIFFYGKVKTSNDSLPQEKNTVH